MPNFASFNLYTFKLASIPCVTEWAAFPIGTSVKRL